MITTKYTLKYNMKGVFSPELLHASMPQKDILLYYRLNVSV